MLHFFRKIRRDLLANSKTYKYLKYAIGEIILVVIGILIALQINNWNEERKEKEQTKILMDEVAQELALNIHKTEKTIDFRINLDTFYFIYLNKELNYEDYISNPNLIEAPLMWWKADLVDDNFKKLIEGYKSFSIDLDTILSDLKDLYGEEKVDVQNYDIEMHDLALVIRDKLKHELPSFAEYRKGYIPDEMIEYCLNNSFYRNEVADIQSVGRNHLLYLNIFRLKALKNYEKICNALDLKKDSTLLKNVKDFEHYKGVYVLNDPVDSIIIKGLIEGEKQMTLKISINDSIRYTWLVSPYTKSRYIAYSDNYSDAWTFELEFNSKDEVIGQHVVGNMRAVDGRRRASKKIE